MGNDTDQIIQLGLKYLQIILKNNLLNMTMNIDYVLNYFENTKELVIL